MMKTKKWIAALVLIAMVTGLCACSNKEPAEEKDTEKKTTVTTETEKKDEPNQVTAGTGTQENHTAGEPDAEEGGSGQAQAKEPVSFVLYNSNEDATALVQAATVETDVLTPENVLAALTEYGVLKEGISILGFEEAELDGEKVLNIDFSQEFAGCVSSMGTAGESMILGSVTNTFLNAYGAERLKITVEGGVLATGHKEYTGYQGYYE